MRSSNKELHKTGSVEVRRCQPWLGTFVRVHVQATDNDLGQNICSAAFESIADIHSKMSFHDPASEISRLNREAFDHPVQVSDETWTVIEHAILMSRLSDGLFDISIGDYRDIELLDDQHIFFRRPLQIDLGGIAKGFAVDQAVAILKARGATDGRVNAGGDLKIFGDKTQTICVRHPHDPLRLVQVANIKEGAFATSADYYGGRIIHPKTKSPSPSHQSVSVAADSCMTADALTKIVSILGEESEPLLARFGAKSIILKPLCYA